MADFQGTLKLHVRFYNRISRLRRSRNANRHACYSLCVRSLTTHATMSQGQLTRGLGTCVFLAGVVFPMTSSVLHVFLQGLHMPYDTSMCI